MVGFKKGKGEKRSKKKGEKQRKEKEEEFSEFRHIYNFNLVD